MHVLELGTFWNLLSPWVMLQMIELARQGGAVPADSRKETKSVRTDSCSLIKMAHEATKASSK